jgi:hypothetical protein
MKIVVNVDNSTEVWALLEKLKEKNLYVNKDFTFRYIPPQCDEGWEKIQRKCVIFDFVDGKNATWFSLII